VKIAGTQEDVIYGMAAELIEDENAYQTMARAVNPYGDGHACARIVDAILYHFGYAEQAPESFLG
jgi:UDP-N-acetylglucosamine 2-epimerase